MRNAVLSKWIRNLGGFLMVEPTEGPWTNDVNWGRGLPVVMPNAQDLVVPVGGLDRVPGPPRVYTLQLTKQLSDPVGAGLFNSNWRCRLQWGLGSLRQSAILDWSDGAHFSLVANEFRVDAVSWRPDVDVPFSGAGLDWVLGFAFGEGERGGPSQALLTEPFVTVNPGGQHAPLVPRFASGVVVRTWDTVALTGNTDPGAPTLVRVRFQDANLTQVQIADANLFAGGGGRGVPLPNGVSSVAVTNDSPNAQEVGIQWVLAL